jgi:hypothetical protein
MAKDSIDKGCPMPKPEDLNEAAIEPDDVGFSAESFRESWSQVMNGETLPLSPQPIDQPLDGDIQVTTASKLSPEGTSNPSPHFSRGAGTATLRKKWAYSA